MKTLFAIMRTRSLKLALTVSAALMLLSANTQAKPQAFTAEYGVYYLGLRAANVTLTLAQEKDSWAMMRRSRAAGVARWLAKDKLKIDEQSWFNFDDKQIKSKRFVLEKPGDKRGRRHIEINFTNSHAVVKTDSGKDSTYPVQNSHDQLSAVAAVMQSMELQKNSESQNDFELSIMGRRGEDIALFKYIDHVQLKTPAGTFETVHLEQKTKKRTTGYWLAVKHNMIPVKILHQEDDEESAEMLVEKLSVGAP